MKTDREWLELAAKAAGLEINNARQAERDALIEPSTASLWLKNGSTAWNPIKDDGDALRLAVKLRMNLNVYATGAEADCDSLESTAKEGGDPYAATRRAIVRAAAAIGEKMP